MGFWRGNRTRPVLLENYLADEHVQGFIRFLADVISGDVPVDHEYDDRFLERLIDTVLVAPPIACRHRTSGRALLIRS